MIVLRKLVSEHKFDSVGISRPIIQYHILFLYQFILKSIQIFSGFCCPTKLQMPTIISDLRIKLLMSFDTI